MTQDKLQKLFSTLAKYQKNTCGQCANVFCQGKHIPILPACLNFTQYPKN